MVPDAADLSTPLAWAMAYAERGWHVLPLEPGQKTPLGRLVPRGMLDATTDFTTIRSWWAQSPRAGVGVALAQSGLVAVDVDPRNGGTETFEQLQVAHGSLRSDVMAFTGGGGEHHVFVVPPGAQISLPGTLGPGVDLKANGYIVVEPSRHPSGRQYGWEASSNPLEGVVPSPLPDWLRSLRVSLKQPELQAGEVAVNPQQARDAREALWMLNADEYQEWLQAGMALHSTRWGHAAYAMWCAWSQQSDKFDAAVCRQKWDSFHDSGEIGGKALTLAWVFGRAQAAGWVNPAARIAEVEEPAERSRFALPLVFSEDVQAGDLKVMQVVEDVLTVGGLSVMYGESNSGKSFLACDMDCAIATGSQWLGKRTVRGAVLYVAGEGAESIKLRVLAWRQHHALEPWLAIVPAAVNLLDKSAQVALVVEACSFVSQHYGAPVCKITVDTLARSFGGGNENAAEDMGAVIAHADEIRAKTGAHVMFVHHSGKDAAKGSRGHSSLKAATDTEIEVTADEATKTHNAEITKQRDLGSRGERLSARFVVVEMGRDQWGKALTTCVVEQSRAPAPPRVHADQKKGADLRAAIVSTLSVIPSRSMRRGALVYALCSSGFAKSPSYRAIDDLIGAGKASEVAGLVHLFEAG